MSETRHILPIDGAQQGSNPSEAPKCARDVEATHPTPGAAIGARQGASSQRGANLGEAFECARDVEAMHPAPGAVAGAQRDAALSEAPGGVWDWRFARPLLGAVLVIVAIMLVSGLSTGTTAAWLSSKSSPVTNTFTCGDIALALTETPTADGDASAATNTYRMQPQATIAKDPKITVAAGSVDSWLFVKLQKSANYDDFLEYELADGWTALDGAEGVFVRETMKSDADQVFSVLKDDVVKVRDSVTKLMLYGLDAEGAEKPTLTITAYAAQKAGISTAVRAWELLGGGSVGS